MTRAEDNRKIMLDMASHKATVVSTTSDPTVNDDTYMIGTIWVNTGDDGTFICTDKTSGAAVWKEITFV